MSAVQRLPSRSNALVSSGQASSFSDLPLIPPSIVRSEGEPTESRRHLLLSPTKSRQFSEGETMSEIGWLRDPGSRA